MDKHWTFRIIKKKIIKKFHAINIDNYSFNNGSKGGDPKGSIPLLINHKQSEMLNKNYNPYY